MVVSLPIDHQSIVRAAEEMISDYGSQALDIATQRAQDLRSEGFESVANTWDLICNAIKDKHEKPKAYQDALQSNIALSE
jgi:hypothetical protein